MQPRSASVITAAVLPCYEFRNIPVAGGVRSGVLSELLEYNGYRHFGVVNFLPHLNRDSSQGRVSVLTGEEFGGLLKSLYEQRNERRLKGRIERIRRMLSKDVTARMVTGSEVHNVREGDDYIVHGVDCENPHVLTGNFTAMRGHGQDYIADEHSEFTRMTLDMTPEEVREIYGLWLQGNKTVRYNMLDYKHDHRYDLMLCGPVIWVVPGETMAGEPILHGYARKWIPIASVT